MRFTNNLKGLLGAAGTVEPEKQTAASEPAKQRDVIVMKSTETPSIHLWSNIFLSNWFFVWVFPIITQARKGLLKFSLRKGETSQVNVDDLERAWNEELTKRF